MNEESIKKHLDAALKGLLHFAGSLVGIFGFATATTIHPIAGVMMMVSGALFFIGGHLHE